MSRRRSIPLLLVVVITAGCASPGSPTAGPPPAGDICPPGEAMVCRGQMASKLKRYDPQFCTCEPLPGIQ